MKSDIVLSVVIVNWNVCALLRKCLLSIVDHTAGLPVEVIVVDNASADNSVHMVKDEFPDVQLIASQANLGYTGGNNVGVKVARGNYFLILNPDTEIVGDALPQMIAYLDAHPDVGCIGPKLRYADGSVQPSRRRFPTLETILADGAVPGNRRWLPKDNRIKRAYYMRDLPDDEIQSVDWLVGAALLIRRVAWEQVGPFDEQFFMYFDEVDWCRRCAAAGWEIHFFPHAQIVHYERASSNQIKAMSLARICRSKVLFLRKYYGRGVATVVRFFFLFKYILLLIEESAKWIVGYRREYRQQLIQDYVWILRSGLV